MAGAMIWLVDAERIDAATLDGWVAWLSASETERYARFVRPERQRQFLTGRVLLRSALAALLDVEARTVLLNERPGLGPRLVMPALPEVGMSISHSGRWVACAVSADTRLGLDVELLDEARDWRSLAQHAFDGATEVTSMTQFYQHWTAQEAACKAGLEPGQGTCLHVVHPDLAIALCTARPLTGPATLHILGDIGE